jgi:hypothetical protein
VLRIRDRGGRVAGHGGHAVTADLASRSSGSASSGTRGDSRDDAPIAGLDSVLAKLDRAEHHLHNLKDELRAYIQTDPVRLVSELNAQGTKQVFRIDLRQELPKGLSLIAGDFVHNLRSSLDHLAWAFAGGMGRAPGTTAWPIITTREELRRWMTVTKGMTDKQRAFVKRFQPYYRDDWITRELALIKRLDDGDKHQQITLLTIGAKHVLRQQHAGASVRYHVTGRLVDGAKFATVTYGGPDPHVYVALNVTAAVAIPRDEGGFYPLPEHAERLLQIVRDEIAVRARKLVP